MCEKILRNIFMLLLLSNDTHPMNVVFINPYIRKACCLQYTFQLACSVNFHTLNGFLKSFVIRISSICFIADEKHTAFFQHSENLCKGRFQAGPEIDSFKCGDIIVCIVFKGHFINASADHPAQILFNGSTVELKSSNQSTLISKN